MKFIKYLFLIILFFYTAIPSYPEGETLTLQAGVSVIESVPKALYGNWRVVSKIQRTNAPTKFKTSTIDLWNLSREGDVINLSNPFTGASATLTLTSAGADEIKFIKDQTEGNIRLTDIVELKVRNEYFTGTNTLYLQTISDITGEVINTKTAKYFLRGEKISGMSIIGK